jgi:hypothetical protein
MLKNKLINDILEKRYHKKINEESDAEKKEQETKESEETGDSEETGETVEREPTSGLVSSAIAIQSLKNITSDINKFLKPYFPPEYSEGDIVSRIIPTNIPSRGPTTVKTKEFNLATGQVISP